MWSTSSPISSAGSAIAWQRVGARQRQVAEGGAALDQLLRRAADDRRAAGDRRLDQLGPVALLVPGQQVARTARTAPTSAEQRQPDHPVQLARRAGRRRTAGPAAGGRRRRRSAPTSRSCAGRARTSRASSGPGCTRPTPRRPSPTACTPSPADAGDRLQHEQTGGDRAEGVPQAGAARAPGRRGSCCPARRGRGDRPARRAASPRVAVGVAGLRAVTAERSALIRVGSRLAVPTRKRW